MTDTPLPAPADPSRESPDASLPTSDEALTRTNCTLFRRSQVVHLDRPMPWLWHGYLSRGQLTLFTGQWKIGKTTLLAALLARLECGGTLAGRQVEPGRAVVITEEGTALWLPRMARHGIGEAVSFAFKPFVRKPLPRQWDYLMTDLADLNRARPIDLVVIDPLASVLPGREEASAAAMIDALRPLRELAVAGPGVLILHHPRKGLALGGQGARGTGALPAFVDVLIEMHWADSGSNDRRRRLHAWSRHDATPSRLLIELSNDGTDYTAIGHDPGDPRDDLDRTLHDLLRSSPGLTAQEIHARWPATIARPRFRALSGRLRDLCFRGRLVRTGRGDRYAPFRHWVRDVQPDLIDADQAGSTCGCVICSTW